MNVRNLLSAFASCAFALKGAASTDDQAGRFSVPLSAASRSAGERVALAPRTKRPSNSFPHDGQRTVAAYHVDTGRRT